MIDRWRTDPTSVPLTAPKNSSGASRRFVEIVPAEAATAPAAASPSPSRDLTIEIALPCGAVVRVGSGVEVESLRRVLRALA
ncbi:MAG: hypothetical protein NTV94_06035 [Planctomycetota bacterium]|nr:hypothetical protein [Planctomycetota bacterium]